MTVDFEQLKKETLIIIQGPAINIPVPHDSSFNGFNVIISTWEGEAVTTTFPVLYNKRPSNPGVHNLNLQVHSTYAGIKYAMDNGFKYVVKWRSDMTPYNFNDLYKSWILCDGPNYIGVGWWCNCSGGYMTDYFMFGEINTMEAIWNPDKYTDEIPEFPEQLITKNILNLNVPVSYIGKSVIGVTDITWYKDHNTINLYKYNYNANFTTEK